MVMQAEIPQHHEVSDLGTYLIKDTPAHSPPDEMFSTVQKIIPTDQKKGCKFKL